VRRKKKVNLNSPSIQSTGNRVHIALPIPVANVNASPTKTPTSANTAAAPLFFTDVGGPGLLVAGVVGVKVAEGLDKHELAAVLAAETLEGASALTVPFPAKLHASGLCPLAS
jgi:hypothetical protein